jgi:hypothetical protein
MHLNPKKLLQKSLSKQGPAKIGIVTWKMPGIIPLIIPFRIPRINP